MSLPTADDLTRATGESEESLATRRAARERLAGYSMPTGREEVWRYLDLDFTLDEFELAGAPPSPVKAPEAGGLEPAGTATILDGSVMAAAAAAPGLTCERAVGPGNDLIDPDRDIFTAAHAAFGSERLRIAVAPGSAVTDPVVVDLAAVSARASFPAVRIEVGDGAEATVALRLRSADELGALVVPHIEGVAGTNATLTVVVDQEWGNATRSIGRVAFDVGPDSSLRLAEAGLGGSLARWQLDIDLTGRGSNARVIGAYFGDREQTLDYRYFMHHAAPNTHSDMFLKGAVEDAATSVFTGMIRIDEVAQKTDAFQTNRNLILSEGATAQSVPNLEILANDVKCGHGSTVGQLDTEQRYYLMSRGLGRERADRLQVRGFFEEALSRFPIAALVGPLRERFNRKFFDAQQEGRV